MTVSELIEVLQEYNPDYEVMISSRTRIRDYKISQDNDEQKLYLNY